MGYPLDELVGAVTTSAAGVISGRTVGFLQANPGLASSVYTYTLSPGANIDATTADIHAVVTGATAAMITVTQTTDNTVLVSTFNAAGAATNAAHQLSVRRKAVG